MTIAELIRRHLDESGQSKRSAAGECHSQQANEEDQGGVLRSRHDDSKASQGGF